MPIFWAISGMVMPGLSGHERQRLAWRACPSPCGRPRRPAGAPALAAAPRAAPCGAARRGARPAAAADALERAVGGLEALVLVHRADEAPSCALEISLFFSSRKSAMNLNCNSY